MKVNETLIFLLLLLLLLLLLFIGTLFDLIPSRNPFGSKFFFPLFFFFTGNAIADELCKPMIFAIKLVANNSYSRSCSQQSLSRSHSSSFSGSIHRARASIVDSTVQVAVMFTNSLQPMSKEECFPPF